VLVLNALMDVRPTGHGLTMFLSYKSELESCHSAQFTTDGIVILGGRAQGSEVPIVRMRSRLRAAGGARGSRRRRLRATVIGVLPILATGGESPSPDAWNLAFLAFVMNGSVFGSIGI
jgi:hypothetical protein